MNSLALLPLWVDEFGIYKPEIDSQIDYILSVFC